MLMNPRQLINQLRVGYFRPVPPREYSAGSNCIDEHGIPAVGNICRSHGTPFFNLAVMQPPLVPFCTTAKVGGIRYTETNPPLHQNFGSVDLDFNICYGDIKYIHNIVLQTPNINNGRYFASNMYNPYFEGLPYYSYDNKYVARFVNPIFI